MILILLIAAAAACVAAGVLSGNILLAYIALGLALLGAIVSGGAAWRERKAEPGGAAEAKGETDDVVETATEVNAVPDDSAEPDEPAGEQSSAVRGAPADRTVSSEEVIPASGRNPVSSNGALLGGGNVARTSVALEAPLEQSQTVYVIPGRKRFHLAGCRILEGRSQEELTLADAEDEGFSSCTSCAAASSAE